MRFALVSLVVSFLSAHAADVPPCIPIANSGQNEVCCQIGVADICGRGDGGDGIVIGGFGQDVSRRLKEKAEEDTKRPLKNLLMRGRKAGSENSGVPAEAAGSTADKRNLTARNALFPSFSLTGTYRVGARVPSAIVNEFHTGVMVTGGFTYKPLRSTALGARGMAKAALTFSSGNEFCRVDSVSATDGLQFSFARSACTQVCDVQKICSPLSLCAMPTGASGEYFVGVVRGKTIYDAVAVSAPPPGVFPPPYGSYQVFSTQVSDQCDTALHAIISGTVGVEVDPRGGYIVYAERLNFSPESGFTPGLAMRMIVAKFRR